MKIYLFRSPALPGQGGRGQRNAIHSAFSAENVNKTTRLLIPTVKIDECIAFFKAEPTETRYISRFLARDIILINCFQKDFN